MRNATNGAQDLEGCDRNDARGRTHRTAARAARTALAALVAGLVLAGCGQGVSMGDAVGASDGASPDGGSGTAVPAVDPSTDRVAELSGALEAVLNQRSGGLGPAAFLLPDSDDFDAIPQDPANPLGVHKVALGRLLFHDTGFALAGRSEQGGTWSCATCHHAAAGFKSGARQGIGEGGTGFGAIGAERALAMGFDAHAAADDAGLPDLQPVASPTVLNAAWQDVMLWNGQFGNSAGGINAGVAPARLMTAGTPKAANVRGFSGLETQAIAGAGVHRLRFDADSPLQGVPEYRTRFGDAFGYDPAEASDLDVTADAALAIAAFERTVIANRAPFQRWLRGDADAMDAAELAGAVLFFGEAGCADCHRGPALGSELGASADQIFFAIGFDDLDRQPVGAHGAVDDATRLGRGGFTGEARGRHAFKIPPLYNLADTAAFGHGASFGSVREVIEHKNAGRVQNPDVPPETIDPRHRALGLDAAQVDALVAFLETGLRDPDLARYQPDSVPSGACVVVASGSVGLDGRCR